MENQRIRNMSRVHADQLRARIEVLAPSHRVKESLLDALQDRAEALELGKITHGD